MGASLTAGAACLLGILVLYCCRMKSKRRAASQALRQSSTVPTENIATGVPVAVPTAVPVAVPTAVPTGWMVERVATTIVKPSPDWKLGITLETVTGSGKIEIVSAAAGSPTEAAGLRAGDVVVEIAGRPAPPTAKECTALLKEAVGECAVTVERKTRTASNLTRAAV